MGRCFGSALLALAVLGISTTFIDLGIGDAFGTSIDRIGNSLPNFETFQNFQMNKSLRL